MAFASVLSLFFLVERNSRNFLTTQVWIKGNRKMAFQSRLRENTIDCVFLLLLFFCDVVSQKNDLLTFCSWISAPPCALRRGRT